MELIRPNININFIDNMRYALLLSLVLIIAGTVSLVVKGGPRYGIDFKGGTLFQIKFSKQVAIGDVRQAVKAMGVKESVVQNFGAEADNEYLINIEAAVEDLEQFSEQFREHFTKTFGEGSFEIRRSEAVGPKVGKDLRQKALLAVALSCIGMLIYIWYRFELRFGLGAICGLVHDVLITLGALSITNTPIDLPVVAALLTIVGYSVNDTIIVCDRIRENMPKMTKKPLREVINISVNQTLSRTILTVATVLMATLALFLFGGGVIHDFAFTILIGIISGTYSSIFIACPIVIYWENLFVTKKKGTVK
ncbi:MAG: protein translocase subunit SecF [Desulfobacterota bacterium]|nr:protein translocase subunit SecF [Thermodesulfobacteriota bacterium]